MVRNVRAVAGIAGCLIVACVALAGCNSAATKATPQEQADFKGGPMPPRVQQMMAERAKTFDRDRQQAIQRGQQALQGQAGR